MVVAKDCFVDRTGTELLDDEEEILFDREQRSLLYLRAAFVDQDHDAVTHVVLQPVGCMWQ